jgi:hypothetical protein
MDRVRVPAPAPTDRVRAPAPATADRVRDPTKGKGLEAVSPTGAEKEQEKEKEKKKKKRAPSEVYEYWETGTSRDAPPSPAAGTPTKPKRRRLRRAVAREDGTTTISVDRNPVRGPPTRTTVRVVPMVGRTQPGDTPPPPPPPPVKVVLTMEEEPLSAATVDGPTDEAVGKMEEDHRAAAADILAEEETLPAAEKEAAVAEEATLPDAEERPAQEQEADPAATSRNSQIPPWNLEERIPFAPQEWDADTPQIGVGAADDGVEIINLEESEQPPVVAEPTH